MRPIVGAERGCVNAAPLRGCINAAPFMRPLPKQRWRQTGPFRRARLIRPIAGRGLAAAPILRTSRRRRFTLRGSRSTARSMLVDVGIGGTRLRRYGSGGGGGLGVRRAALPRAATSRHQPPASPGQVSRMRPDRGTRSRTSESAVPVLLSTIRASIVPDRRIVAWREGCLGAAQRSLSRSATSQQRTVVLRRADGLQGREAPWAQRPAERGKSCSQRLASCSARPPSSPRPSARPAHLCRTEGEA